MATRRPLSGTVGNVLDPVFALRRRMTLAPDESRRCTFIMSAGATRADALAVLDALATPDAIDAARAESQRAAIDRLERLQLTLEETDTADALAGALLYGDPRLRAEDDVLRTARNDGAVRSALGLGRATSLVIVDMREPGADETWS